MHKCTKLKEKSDERKEKVCTSCISICEKFIVLYLEFLLAPLLIMKIFLMPMRKYDQDFQLFFISLSEEKKKHGFSSWNLSAILLRQVVVPSNCAIAFFFNRSCKKLFSRVIFFVCEPKLRHITMRVDWRPFVWLPTPSTGKIMEISSWTRLLSLAFETVQIMRITKVLWVQ